MGTEEKMADLESVIESSRDEARDLLKAITEHLPNHISAVAGMMASVDLVSHMLFASVDTIDANMRAEGQGDRLDAIAKQGVRMLQELLNIRLSYELAKRGILACDCPKCLEDERATGSAPVNIKLH